jgi:hypothetical protein
LPLTRLTVSLIIAIAILAGFIVLVLVINTQPVEAGCKKKLEMGKDRFVFETECQQKITNAAKEAAIQTGASQSVANAAAEAAAKAAGASFPSESSLSTVAQQIAKQTSEAVASTAIAQGENLTAVTKTATAAGAAAAATALGTSPNPAAKSAAAAANASSVGNAS